MVVSSDHALNTHIDQNHMRPQDLKFLRFRDQRSIIVSPLQSVSTLKERASLPSLVFLATITSLPSVPSSPLPQPDLHPNPLALSQPPPPPTHHLPFPCLTPSLTKPLHLHRPILPISTQTTSIPHIHHQTPPKPLEPHLTTSQTRRFPFPP